MYTSLHLSTSLDVPFTPALQHILEEKRRQLASEYPEEALLMVGIGERVHVQPASGSNGHETPDSSLQPILQCLVTMEHALLDVCV